MEPITVIDLPALAKGYLNERGMVRLAVQLPPMLSVLAAQQAPRFDGCKTVTIFAERFVRNGREHTMLFTRDEESALLLKCAFLPGQQAGLQERERTAFARGFWKRWPELATYNGTKLTGAPHNERNESDEH